MIQSGCRDLYEQTCGNLCHEDHLAGSLRLGCDAICTFFSGVSDFHLSDFEKKNINHGPSLSSPRQRTHPRNQRYYNPFRFLAFGDRGRRVDKTSLVGYGSPSSIDIAAGLQSTGLPRCVSRMIPLVSDVALLRGLENALTFVFGLELPNSASSKTNSVPGQRILAITPSKCSIMLTSPFSVLTRKK